MKRAIQTLISIDRKRTATVFQDVHTGDFTIDICEGLQCVTLTADDKSEALSMAEDYVQSEVDCEPGNRCNCCVFCLNGQRAR